MPKYSTPPQPAQQLLLCLFNVARWLSVISCRLDRENLRICSLRRRRNKLLMLIWRVIIVFLYIGLIPRLFGEFVQSRDTSADFFAMLQSSSVALFAVANFIIQAGAESKFIAILNRYLALYLRISRHTGAAQLLPSKLLVLYGLKLGFTLGGCFFELRPLLRMKHFLDLGRLFDVIWGVYMWLGTLFVLDACFLGFLVAGIMYEHMGRHIQQLLERMLPIELEPMSQHKRMRLLCDYSDTLDASGAIYRALYTLTRSFRRICQWQILFYIYYNYIIILLSLYDCLRRYLEAPEEGLMLMPLLLVASKLANLVLLIMCADYTVRKSQLPERLPLDIVCSDIDRRWDASVESFLSQQKSLHLEFKLLGFFHLNNRFILLILSAIISYLFILIQFGMTGGFEESKYIKKLTKNEQQ